MAPCELDTSQLTLAYCMRVWQGFWGKQVGVVLDGSVRGREGACCLYLVCGWRVGLLVGGWVAIRSYRVVAWGTGWFALYACACVIRARLRVTRACVGACVRAMRWKPMLHSMYGAKLVGTRLVSTNLFVCCGHCTIETESQ